MSSSSLDTASGERHSLRGDTWRFVMALLLHEVKRYYCAGSSDYGHRDALKWMSGMAWYSWADSILRDYDNHKRWALSYQGKQLARTVELLVATSLEWARPRGAFEPLRTWIWFSLSSHKDIFGKDALNCLGLGFMCFPESFSFENGRCYSYISSLEDNAARTRSTKVWSCNGLLRYWCEE